MGAGEDDRARPARWCRREELNPFSPGKSQEPVQSGADGKMSPAPDSNRDDRRRRTVLYPLS